MGVPETIRGVLAFCSKPSGSRQNINTGEKKKKEA